MTQNTIYSIYKNQPNKAGTVEIINMYDNRYFSIAIDGEIIRTTYKESYETTVLKSSFIKDCVKKSGVKKNELLFVYIDWENFGHENMADYDANDYEDYSKFIQFFSQNQSSSNQFKWRKKYFEFIKVLATGIDELEIKI